MSMKYNKILLLSLLLTGLCFRSFAQDCPPNIDFELGNTSVWNYFIGTCCPINTPTATAAMVGRHTLTSGAGTDMYGGFPIVAPGGGSFSLKLGNDNVGSEAEKARYYIHVPTSVSNYSLIYRYAVVLEDGGSGHDATSQPRFEVHAYDSATNVPIACAQYNYNYTSGLPGFTHSAIGGDVYYKGWTTASINLSGLGGTTIRIDFASGDCDLGGHFGYGYLDMSCGLFSISAGGCDSTTTTLTAPAGFSVYTWYDSLTFTTIYGTTQSITLPMPPVATTYAVIMQPYAGFGCPDTLYTRVRPSHLQLHPSNDTTLCFGNPITITSGATDVALPLTYSWSPALGLSCTTCANPIATPTVNTDYVVTVTNDLGCTKTDTIRIFGGHVTVSATSDSVSCYAGSDGKAYATVGVGVPPFSYVWSSSPVQTSSVATGLPTGPFTVTVTDNSGCTGTASTTVQTPPQNIISIVGTKNISTCGGNDGYIKLGGLPAGFVMTVNYLDSGVANTYTGTVSPTGILTIPSLYQGLYSNISIVPVAPKFCTYNIVGPVALVDTLHPAIPFVNSNSPVCEGDPLNLYGSDGTAGVTFSWTGPNGFTSALQNPIINPAVLQDSGRYILTVGINNCFSKDSTWVVVNPIPQPFASNNSPFCAVGNLQLTAGSANGGTNYTWSGPNAYSSILQNPVLTGVDQNASGVYTVTAFINACRASATTNVVIYPIPPVPAVTNVEYCQYGISAPLTATGTNILWYTDSVGGTGSAIAPTPSTLVPGLYTWYVNQTSATGCVGPRTPITARIAPYPSPYVTESDSVICTGTNVTFLTANTGEGFTGLVWSFSALDSVRNTNPVIHGFTTPGTYAIAVTAYYDICPDTTMFLTLGVYPTPVINLGQDTTICEGSNPIQLYDLINAGTLGASWVWNSGELTPSINVITPGSYYATVSINGCSASDTVNVLADCYMEIPNAFTPNGDGINDYFFPRGYLTKGLTAFKMEIYNRWGEMIFSTNKIDGLGWDGKYNGEIQPQGVFVYYIDATFKDGKKEHHNGNFTLLR